MMSKKILNKVLAVIWIVFVMAAVIGYFVGGEQFRFSDSDSGKMVQATNDTGELTTGKEIRQRFRIDADQIMGVDLSGYDYHTSIGGTMTVNILNKNDDILLSRDYDMAVFSDNETAYLSFDGAVNVVPGELLTLQIISADGSEGSVPTLFYGSTISLSKGEVAVILDESEKLIINGEVQDGKLCFKVSGRKKLMFGDYYWIFAAAAAVMLGALTLFELICFNKQKNTVLISIIRSFEKYKYLLGQLISRDFKRKYKRSVLGVLWSLLNPMLVMIVQYIVFSTIFKSNIENFAVYLLTGIVCYNFFSEVTNMALTSIVENTSLITKVYIPKIIYPISRTASSGINFLFSLIPLAAVMIATKTPITSAALLIPFDVLCLLMLSLGVGLILASLMVFFRDMQFLWGVVSMIWMYMTPIFYPETIITGWLSYIFKLNPLYHIIRFFRIILLNGVSPEPRAYLFCFISSLIPLLIGITVFRKTEDKFVLYI